MELVVNFAKLIRNPGSFAIGTACYDPFKGAIDCNREPILIENALKRSRVAKAIVERNQRPFPTGILAQRAIAIVGH